jgi:CheY-like chemotaxis protein
VIETASFLVPMVTPLFLNSGPCREEVDLFLAHERKVGRDDLILPVYFHSSAKLEKDEEKARDAIATELAKRQMFDWREKANVPLQEPTARSAVLALATAVAAAIERLQTPRPRSVDEAVARAPGPAAGEADARPRGAARAADARIVNLHGQAKREPLSEKVILWVDDRPRNNEQERQARASYGLRFVLATETARAEALLREQSEPFAAVISDMRRGWDFRAGFTLLQSVRGAGLETPYFIYSSSRAPDRVREALARGAQGATNDPDELVAMVVAAVR